MFPLLDEQVAHHLGFSELRVGAERKGSHGEIRPKVLAWWAVSVIPSLDLSWRVGAIHEEYWISGPKPERIVVRGFVVDTDGATEVELEADTVLEALAALNPFRVEPTRRTRGGNPNMWCEIATLDGLGYSLRWGTRAVGEGKLSFSNPEAIWLMDFERILFRFARNVVAASGETRFEAKLKCWRWYRPRLKMVGLTS